MTADESKGTDAAGLRAAWDELIDQLQQARDTIDNPEFFPPRASPRVLAEGYRYLAGFVHHGVERAFHEDPDFPAFRNILSPFNKATIDNADAIYFGAAVDGRQRYLVKGKAANFAHWRGEPRASAGALAPQYLIFESSDGPLAGDTGELAELAPGYRTGFGTIDSTKLRVEPTGEFEILIAPEKPEGYTGNFLCGRKPPRQAGDAERFMTYVSGRQLFYDWEREEPIHLAIVPLDNIGGHPDALTPENTAARLRRMGSIVRGQMRFWLNFYDTVLNSNQSHDPDGGRYFMPVNAYNRPNAASGATGGGMSTNIYAGGIYELAEGEALYIEATYPGDPIYSGMHLANMWGESPDFANHQSSLNLLQMHMGADRVQRWVVAHRDPGIQNWVDTTGLPKGFLSHRWAYAELPPEGQWPTIRCEVIRFDQVGNYMPDDMPVITPEQRRQAIQIRQQHVQRRYRVF